MHVNESQDHKILWGRPEDKTTYAAFQITAPGKYRIAHAQTLKIMLK